MGTAKRATKKKVLKEPRSEMIKVRMHVSGTQNKVFSTR